MDSSRFIICRASAGSGKTYTLVRQYLELAFSAKEQDLPKRFARILAITFTNKAANEMKERIMRELDNISQLGTDTAMGKDIADDMRLNDSTLKRYATIVRKAILHNYSDFAVCTIDSFMNRLVRTFAHDLGLPMNFELYLDNTELIQSAVDSLMALVGTDGQEELTKAMCEFAESKMTEDRDYLVDNELKRLAEELFKERTPEYLKDLSKLGTAEFLQIRREMKEANNAYINKIKALGQQALDAISAAGVGLDDFYHKSSGAGRYFEKLANGIIAEPNSYALGYLEGDKLSSSKDKAVLAAVTDLKPLLADLNQQICAIRENEETDFNTRNMLLKNLYELALLNKMNELVASYSQENEVVHLSEFNKQINAVVQDEPTPFIYERIGNRYYNYLIDEFQDTSRLQWQNLVPLVENGVSAGHTSLVVGDGKQAIYRFRQGEVKQFVDLPHVDNVTHGRLLESPGVGLPQRLAKNFRTARTVVEFNNDFFTWATTHRFADNQDLQDIYIGSGSAPDLAQEPTKEGGYVQFGFWNHTKTDPVIWDEMVKDIREQVDQKGYSYRDITILARKNAILTEITAVLTEHGIPVVSNESFLLTQSRIVKLMVSVLEYLLDANDRVAAQKILIHLYDLGMVKQRLTAPAPEDNTDLDTILRNEGFELNSEKLRHLGLYDCCEEALRMLHLNGLETAYTATWLNVVAKYSNSHRQDIAEFLEWFNEKKEKLSTCTAQDLDAVQLMTIHKAKGLESPIILFLSTYQKRPQPNSIWVHIPNDKGLSLPASLVTTTDKVSTIFDNDFAEENQKVDMDNLNTLYVALTRPKDKLFVYCDFPPQKPSSLTQLPTLLKDYKDSCEEICELRENVYYVGENNSKKAKEVQTDNITNIEMNALAFPGWSHRISIAEQSQKIFGEIDEEPIRRGNQLHELLSQVHHSGEMAALLEEYVSKKHICAEEAEELKKITTNMLSQSEVARFFAPEHTCKNECSMVVGGEVLRPDRIVFTPTETWVVDFKTGAPKTDHQAQVSHYCQAITDMGYPNVKGYLMYIGTEHCQVLPCF